MTAIEYKKDLHPQMIKVLEEQAEAVPGGGKAWEVGIEEARRLYETGRAYWRSDAPEVAKLMELCVRGPAGDIPLRVYLPELERPLPALVYLHGGGWVHGSMDSHDKIMRLLALRSGAAVVGVDYRLAPEHKFPTAIEEILAVIAHLRERGDDWGIDRRRLAIGGDSAGANLSMAVTLTLRDTEPHVFSLLLLLYGVFGLQDSTSRRLYGHRGDGLSCKDMDYYSECYLRRPEDRFDHRFDVLAADLRGLPPAFIAAAGLDPLLDDSVVLKALMDDAGVASRLKVYEGVLHGFLHYTRSLDAANEAIDDAAQAIREAFAAQTA